MYKEIWNILYNKILSNTKFAEVFNYEKTSIESFPCALIYPNNSNAYIFDNIRHSSTYYYTIRLIVQNVDRSVMEDRMRVLVDSVIWDIRTIPSTCELNYINIETNWGRTNDEQPLRVVDINCECKVLETMIWN